MLNQLTFWFQIYLEYQSTIVIKFVINILMGNCAFQDDVMENDSQMNAEQTYQKIKLNLGMNAFQTVNDGPINSYRGWKKSLDPSHLLTPSMYLEQLMESILDCYQLRSIFNQKVFRNMASMNRNLFIGQNQKKSLINLLENYIQFTTKQLKTYSPSENIESVLTDYTENFSVSIVEIFSDAKTKQVGLTAVSKYSEEKFSKYAFIMGDQEINKMSNEVKKLCNRQMVAISYLAQYFVKSCENLKRSGKSVDEINKLLKDKADILKKKFGVLKTRQEIAAALANNDQYVISASLKSKIESFKKVTYKPKVIMLNSSNKEEQLDNEIMKFVEFGIKNFSLFDSIVHMACTSNNGFGFKSNMKLTSKENKSSLMRVKEKLLKDLLKQAVPVTGCSSIEQLIKKEEQLFKDSMKKAYSNMAQIQFTVTDIVRGKCHFNKKEDIYKAAEKIIQRVEEEARKSKDISVIEVQDRFDGICQDLVFKIRIGDLVCEFQLVLNFLEVENAFHHKMYQLGRSKILSPIYLLYEWNQKAATELFALALNQKTSNAYVVPIKKDYSTNFKYDTVKMKEDLQKLGQQKPTYISRLPKLLEGCTWDKQKYEYISKNTSKRSDFLLSPNSTNTVAVNSIKKQVANGQAQEKQSNIPAALNIYNSCLAAMEKKVGKSSKETAIILTHVGAIYNKIAKYELALLFLGKAGAIFQGLELKNSEQYGRVCRESAIALQKLGRYQEAYEECSNPINFYLKDLDKYRIELGEVHFCMERCQVAMKGVYNNWILSSYKFYKDALGGGSLVFAGHLDAFAQYYQSVGDNSKAQKYAEESKKIKAK